MSDISNKRIEDLIERIDKSRGMFFLKRMKLHSFSGHIFFSNLHKLDTFLKEIEKPEKALPLWSANNKKKFEATQREILCLFHNFLAGAKTLIDHSRNFIDDCYGDHEFSKEYSSKVNQIFAKDPLARFVQDLRNYIVHKGIPLTTMTLSLKPGVEIKHSICLDVEALRKWDKWENPSQTYLKALGNSLSFRVLSSEYGKKVSEFYKWFEKRLNEIHASDLAQLEALQKKFESITSMPVKPSR
jgi:hypothetical protein